MPPTSILRARRSIWTTTSLFGRCGRGIRQKRRLKAEGGKVVTRTNVLSLNPVLTNAERGGYAVGSFSPRSTAMIRPVLQAGQALQSPLIVQISQKELERHQSAPSQFADAFYREVEQLKVTIPVVLHLDRTKQFAVIEEAIAAGFTSVMID